MWRFGIKMWRYGWHHTVVWRSCIKMWRSRINVWRPGVILLCGASLASWSGNILWRSGIIVRWRLDFIVWRPGFVI